MIVTRCCCNVLGSQLCVKMHYASDPMNKSCPLCRSPRGFSDTMLMSPLDELVDAVRNEMVESDDEA